MKIANCYIKAVIPFSIRFENPESAVLIYKPAYCICAVIGERY